ncbi:MAG: O-antigen ligase family protein [Candidatus Omnitrophica bacterium]|nr:O-antigen ligase family protein [Candidatus Omnitrophota bacterium]
MFIIKINNYKRKENFYKKSQIFSYLSILIIFFLISINIFFFGHSFKYLIFALLGIVIFLISFANTNFALMLLIFSMLLSPEFSLGFAGGRAVVLRLDDLFLIVVFLGWLAKMATAKLGFFRKTPLNFPIFIYLTFYTISTFFGIIRGYVTFKDSIFYLLKYFEYFFLYFMVADVVVEEKQARIFVYAILFVSIITSLYAFRQHFSGIERVTAPFEEKEVESNTFGGYLVLISLLAISLFLNVSKLKLKIFFGIVIFLSIFSLLFTLSRGSWLAFILGYIAIFFVSKKGKITFLITTILLCLLLYIFLPARVLDRIKYTFTPETQKTVFGKKINLDASAAARIENWFYSLQLWSKYPILGRGAGSARVVVDHQYGRILLEAGFFGILAFLFLIFGLFRSFFFALNILKDNEFALGLSTGAIAILFSFLFHSLSCETFIVIRIMEPFWFLTAVVVALPDIFLEKFGL